MATQKQKEARRKNLLKLIMNSSLKNQTETMNERELYLWKIIQSAAAALSAENEGKNEIWKTGANVIIALQDMENDHVSNCVNFIRREGLNGKEIQYSLFWKFMFIGEMIRRGNKDSILK